MIRTVLITTAAIGLLACRSWEPATSEEDCQVTNAEDVARAPLKYEGQRFCGTVHPYVAGNILAFSAKPKDSFPGGEFPESYFADRATLLIGTNTLSEGAKLDLERKRSVRVEAIVRPIKECFDPNRETCVPVPRPVFLDQLRVAGTH